MRRALAILATLLAVTGATRAADGPADPFTGIRFTDGKARSIADLGDQTVVMVYFCGHCPSAAKFMRTQAKTAHDLIEERKVPMQLVCVTPDLTPQDLVEWTKSNGLENALVGQDTLNPYKVGLQNILQERDYRGGKQVRVSGFGNAFSDDVRGYLDKGNVGTFRYPLDGLTEDKARTLWWMVERDRPQAMEMLVAARKNKALKDDAEKIYAVVEASLVKRQDALLAADISMATYEGLETLLTQAKPIALKPATEKLKELGKDATIKTELKARAIYQQCQELLAHPNPQKQQAGREGLETLAKKYGETVYGKKAGGG
jgi:hypothetical protein